MPTTTVYTNRAANPSNSGSYMSFPCNPLDVELSYRGATTGVDKEGVFGFNVPQNLYGKQVVSGNVTFTMKQTTSRCNHPGYCFLADTPKDLDVNSVTYSDLKTKTGESLDARSPRDDFQNQTHANSSVINMLLCGLRVIVGNEYSNLNYVAQITVAPAVSFVYNDVVVPQVLNKPRTGYHDPHKTIKLSYRIKEDIIGGVNVLAQQLKWRIKGQMAVETVSFEKNTPMFRHERVYIGSNGYYSQYELAVPEETFPTNTFVEWQIQAKIDGNWWSDNAEWSELSTVDSLSTAVPIEPLNMAVSVGDDAVFRWKHVISTGSDSTGFDLHYTNGLSGWKQIANPKNGNTSYIVPADTLPAGKLSWRVRTYNADGIAGEWSESITIIGYGAPPSPIISEITNGARPRIKWQSETQIAFELKIIQGEKEIYTIDETASTDKAHKLTDFLHDGTYTAKIRIKNSGLYWSKWAEKSFIIATEKPDQPRITGRQIKNGIIVETDFADTMYLLRDGIPIAKFYGNQANDYATIGMHEYVIRRVNNTGDFSDSVAVKLTSVVDQAIVASSEYPEEMIGSILQMQANQYPSTVAVNVSFKNYAGRKYPVSVMDESVSEEFSPQFAAMNTAQYEALRRIMEDGEPAIYRNNAGDCAHCIISSMSPVKQCNGFISWEMTMQKIDFTEKIRYDEVN